MYPLEGGGGGELKPSPSLVGSSTPKVSGAGAGFADFFNSGFRGTNFFFATGFFAGGFGAEELGSPPEGTGFPVRESEGVGSPATGTEVPKFSWIAVLVWNGLKLGSSKLSRKSRL